ncbi:AcrR family transcriptional regulator [Paenibacillus sp. DS2015]|uniref:TetR/AcrR family transcriptional regulator n=1 Tax=Paenibacillus sp. DS2015 TaxID=3373917 RepID=UPI003D2017C3
MARNVERDVQLREKQRNNILDKSRQLFAIRGLQGVRMQDIAQASGITPANVYHYFNSKEDLLMEVILQSQLLSGILAEGQQQGQIKAGDPMQMAARYVISLSGFNVYCSTDLYEGIQFEFEDIIAHLRQE